MCRVVTRTQVAKLWWSRWMLGATLLLQVLCQVVQAQYDYASVLNSSFFFYEAQASGLLPTWNRASKSNGGWRYDSYLEDGKDISKNLVGGWFDAGDHLKFTLPLSSSITQLAWGMLEFEEAYQASGQWEIARNNLLWAGDWLVRAHTTSSDSPAENVLVVQVGTIENDHSFWCRPEDYKQEHCCPATYYSDKTGCSIAARQTFIADASRPASNIAASAAAAMIALALVLERDDPNSASSALLAQRARQLYAYAKYFKRPWEMPAGYTNGYPDTFILDDMLWAAVWLCKFDGTASDYCKTDILYWYNEIATKTSAAQLTYPGIDWANTFSSSLVLLNTMTGIGSAIYANKQSYASVWASMAASNLAMYYDPVNCTNADGEVVISDGTLCISKSGLIHFSQWGTLRYASNIAAVMLIHAKYANQGASFVKQSRCWAVGQVNRMLGDLGRSYVVGFGINPPKRPHHRSSSCYDSVDVPCDWKTAFFVNADNPHILRGALVGGPDSNDVYVDDRADYQKNEVALDYNAGFTTSVAAMLELQAAYGNLNKYCSGLYVAPSLPQPPPSSPTASTPTPPAPDGTDVPSVQPPPPQPANAGWRAEVTVVLGASFDTVVANMKPFEAALKTSMSSQTLVAEDRITVEQVFAGSVVAVLRVIFDDINVARAYQALCSTPSQALSAGFQSQYGKVTEAYVFVEGDTAAPIRNSGDLSARDKKRIPAGIIAGAVIGGFFAFVTISGLLWVHQLCFRCPRCSKPPQEPGPVKSKLGTEAPSTLPAEMDASFHVADARKEQADGGGTRC